jgi:hypothetical protein
MKRLVMIAAMLLAGCATQQQHALQDYIAANKPRAIAGTMKWSDFYRGGYNLAAQANVSGDSLARINDAIRDADLYESGAITQREFEYRQRSLQADQKAAEDKQAAVRSAQVASQIVATAQLMQASQPQVLAHPIPAISPTGGVVGFLQNQSVNGMLRYCRYSNGVVVTISSVSLCPLNTQ